MCPRPRIMDVKSYSGKVAGVINAGDRSVWRCFVVASCFIYGFEGKLRDLENQGN